jgi:TolB-like protein
MRGFIEELRYRNVFRVAIAYVVAGWLVAQVADLAADAFNAPDWVMQMLIVLLLVGLPIALFFAWAYELTPEGVKKAKDLPLDTPKDPRSGRILNRITLVALVVAVAWLGWDKVQREEVAPGVEEASAVEKSVAVLPFADFSPDGDHGWFADGLTDEILNALARVRDLRVASRSSAFQYRDAAQDIPRVAAELGVAHILEGSVRRAGDRMRITAQLIRASDDAHLWSETYDASSEDSIEIQEKIAFEIASVLDTAMDPAEIERMVAAGTQSIPAWESYLRLLDVANRSFIEQDASRNEEIFRYYEEIIALDPAFAEPHIAVADALYGWLNPSDYRMAPPGYTVEDLKARFREAATAAARLARTEPTRLRAEILRANIEVQLDRLIELTRARLALLPNDNFAWYEHIEALLQASRYDEAHAVVDRFFADRPDNNDHIAQLMTPLARVHFEGGQRMADEAVQQAETSPGPGPIYQAHRIYLYAGRIDEARDLAERYLGFGTDPMLRFLVRLRQACAEGRVADADALFDAYDFEVTGATMNTLWLALKTLGRNEDAQAALVNQDNPETLYALAGHLTYSHFDPRPFPLLTRTLEAQGVMRKEIKPLNFACKREAGN